MDRIMTCSLLIIPLVFLFSSISWADILLVFDLAMKQKVVQIFNGAITTQWRGELDFFIFLLV